MRRVREVIVVEGRYDKQAVLRAVDAVVVQTNGFGIFKDQSKRAALISMARRYGLIVLTDSDGAGKVIRGHLKGLVPPENIKQAFVPELYGKERRKAAASKEGKLGVEAMPPEVIVSALQQAGATFDGIATAETREVTIADLYDLGLTGSPGSKAKRQSLTKKLQLPENISNKDLCRVLSRYPEKEYDDWRYNYPGRASK